MAITKVTSGLISADASSIDLNIDAGTLYLDVSENRVGIGTSSPSQALEVTGITLSDGYRTAEDNTNYSLLTRNSSNTAVYIQQAGSGNILDVQSGSAGAGQGTSRLLVNSSGNVGIGTTSPTSYYSGADNLVVHQSSGEAGMTIATANNTTGALYFADGTSGSEAYQGGIAYSHGAEILNLVSGGSNKMTIDSSGNVGIGTTSPQSGLHIADGGSGSDGGSVLTLSQTGFGSIVNNDDLGSVHFGGVTSGGVGIHNAAKIMVEGDATWASNDYPTRMSFFTTADGASSATERMRIDSSGNLIVGKTSTDFNTAGFHLAPEGAVYSGIQTVSASSSYHLRDTTNNTWEFYVTGAGQIHATSTSITSLSDKRLKENIKDLETGLTEVMSLKPRRFDWKDRKEKNVAGFIAQEVETVLPDLIDDFMHDDLEDAKSVKMSDMIPTLVKAIQELSDKVDNQQTIIDNLKTRIETLENA